MLMLRKDFDIDKLENHSRHTTKMREERRRHHHALQNERERERHTKEKLAMLKNFQVRHQWFERGHQMPEN
jgi:hypothetical protein